MAQPLSKAKEHTKHKANEKGCWMVMLGSSRIRVLVPDDADHPSRMVHDSLQGVVGAGQGVHHHLNGDSETPFHADLGLNGEVPLGLPHELPVGRLGPTAEAVVQGFVL